MNKEKILKLLSEFSFYNCFFYVVFFLIVIALSFYFVIESKETSMLTENLISSSTLLYLILSVLTLTNLTILSFLIFGVVRKVHDFFTPNFHLKTIIPIVACVGINFVLQIIYTIFLIEAISNEDEAVSSESIFKKPQLHLFFNILLLGMTFFYIGYFGLLFVLKIQ